MTVTRGNLFDVLNASPGEIAGVEVYIVGTAHISAQSAADVEENRKKRPRSICENSEITAHNLENIHKQYTYTIYSIYIYTRIQWFICKYRLGDFTQNGDFPHLTCKMMNQNSVICPSIAGGWWWLVICSSNHTDSVSIV